MDDRRVEPVLHVRTGEGVGGDSRAAEAHLRDTGEERRRKTREEGRRSRMMMEAVAGAAGGDAWDQEASAQGVCELPQHSMPVGGGKQAQVAGGLVYVQKDPPEALYEGRRRACKTDSSQGGGTFSWLSLSFTRVHRFSSLLKMLRNLLGGSSCTRTRLPST